MKFLIFNKASTIVSVEYSNYGIVFSAKNAAKLSEYIKINDHAIILEKSKQPPFKSIYNLKLVELKTLKMYIRTNLVNNFIWPFKFLAKCNFLAI